MIVRFSSQELNQHSQTIRKSGLFDDGFYRISASAVGKEFLAPGIDLVRHYLAVGERKGYRPSSRFDPVFYFEANPDVRASMSALLHYVLHGINEGRSPLPISENFTFPAGSIDFAKETILLLVHDATRTGAPIVGWNLAKTLSDRFNVVLVLLNGGELAQAFVTLPGVTGGRCRWPAQALGLCLGPLHGAGTGATVPALVCHREQRCCSLSRS